MSDAPARPIALVIDDELEIRRFLRVSLNANGYDVHEAAAGADGLAQAATLRPEIIILDIGLPDISGLEGPGPREWSRVPVIALSARHGESDKIAMLDAGANDDLTKPFSVGELMARIRRPGARRRRPRN